MAGKYRHEVNGSKNPFQDDQMQIWQSRNISNQSSPEVTSPNFSTKDYLRQPLLIKVPVDPKYDYHYKRVTDGPSTPDLKRGHNNVDNQTSDFHTSHSNASGSTSHPQSPQLIQVHTFYTTNECLLNKSFFIREDSLTIKDNKYTLT